MRFDDMGKLSRPIKHGTYFGYSNKKCRCDACRKAMNEYVLKCRIERNKKKDKWAIA